VQDHKGGPPRCGWRSLSEPATSCHSQSVK
jgi:hypothetical protein